MRKLKSVTLVGSKLKSSWIVDQRIPTNWFNDYAYQANIYHLYKLKRTNSILKQYFIIFNKQLWIKNVASNNRQILTDLSLIKI